MPATANIKESGATFVHYGVLWTPAVVILDPGGEERFRSEGYLPKDEFRAQLEMGLARTALTAKKWKAAGEWYTRVARQETETFARPEAMYWQGVCRYRAANDHAALHEVAEELRTRYPHNLWTAKASVWLG